MADNISTLTPEQMYRGVHDRIIALAESVIKLSPRLKCIIGEQYKFDFDKKAIYGYKGTQPMPFYPDKFAHVFFRVSDNALLYATKYSQSPEKIN